jgi:hypothetical protein
MVYQIGETEKIPNVFCFWYHSTFSGLVVIELFLEMPIFLKKFQTNNFFTKLAFQTNIYNVTIYQIHETKNSNCVYDVLSNP